MIFFFFQRWPFKKTLKNKRLNYEIALQVGPDMIICAPNYKKMYAELFLVNKFGRILRICVFSKHYQLFNSKFSKEKYSHKWVELGRVNVSWPTIWLRVDAVQCWLFGHRASLFIVFLSVHFLLLTMHRTDNHLSTMQRINKDINIVMVYINVVESSWTFESSPFGLLRSNLLLHMFASIAQ